MDKETKPTFKQSSKNIRRHLSKLLVHILCQLLLFQQLTYSQAVLAADNSQVGLPSISPKTVEEYNQIQEENKISQAGKGSISSCNGQRTTYDSYTTRQNEFRAYSNNLSNSIKEVVGDAGSQLNHLIGAQQQFYEANMGFSGSSEAAAQDAKAKKERILAAQEDRLAAADAQKVAKQEFNTARAACKDKGFFCSSAERERIQKAKVNLTTANKNFVVAKKEYNAAKSDYKKITNERIKNSNQAANSTAGNAAQMNASHSVSGCGSNYDITSNTAKDCSLSGPLFQEDNALTEIANQNLSKAKQLAASREHALFSLELQQKYDADYKLYKLAVDNATGEVQGRDVNGDGDFDDVELGEYTTKNQVAANMELSNMKSMSLASASVRNMVCEKHDKSENDPQSYYLFRAAMATWLTSVVNDTDYYNEESSCMANEDITSDKNNEQVQTIQKVVNLSERQLKSLCLRTRPGINDVIDTTDSSFLDDNNPNGWNRFNIRSKPETIAYVTKLNKVITGYTDPDSGVSYPPLSTRCDEYLKQIIGPSYDPSKPRTREYALEMVTDALGVAVEELATKRKKLAIAYANVQKGKAWVKRVERDIKSMVALAAIIYAAYLVMAGICPTLFGSWACPIAAVLQSKWLYITGVVIGVWLISELARAQSYLAKWKKKLDTAKYFSHMACNFENAHGEQTQLESLGNTYNQRRKKAMKKAANGAINRVNHILYEEISGNKVSTKTTPKSTQYKKFEKAIEQINRNIVDIKSVQNLRKRLSLLFFKSKDRWQDVTTLFSTLGISILVNALPGEEALAAGVNQAEIYATTSSLNIQTGTGNFKYFLTQRNQQFQNLTNDITNQPKHTSANSEISNSGIKNVAQKVILTVDQLAKPFLGGDGHDPLNDISPSKYNNPSLTLSDRAIVMKTGMATPETRVVTIQNALNLLSGNINQLNFSTAVAGYNLDQYVSLLETTKKELKITDQGLGGTPSVGIPDTSNSCLSQDANGQMNPDPMCSCRESNSCASFSFPTFNVEVPEALRNSGNSAIKTANNITNGNLNAANVSAGNLIKQAGRVKNLIKTSSKNLSNSSYSDPYALTRASENKINRTLAKIGDNPRSAFNQIRKSFVKNGLTGSASINGIGAHNIATSPQSNTLKNNNQTNSSKNAGTTQAQQAGNGGVLGSWATQKGAKGREDFNLSELEDEQKSEKKREYENIGDGLTNKDVVTIDQNNRGHIRTHQRSSPNPQGSGLGVNGDREKSLFSIISKRYEKSAFPIFLRKRTSE